MGRPAQGQSSLSLWLSLSLSERQMVNDSWTGLVAVHTCFGECSISEDVPRCVCDGGWAAALAWTQKHVFTFLVCECGHHPNHCIHRLIPSHHPAPHPSDSIFLDRQCVLLWSTPDAIGLKMFVRKQSFCWLPVATMRGSDWGNVLKEMPRFGNVSAVNHAIVMCVVG